MADIASFTLELRPSHHAQVPTWLGRSAHAWLLREIETCDAVLSKFLHDTQGLKPFTAGTLFPLAKAELLSLHPTESYQLRLTTLIPELTNMLQSILAPRWLANGISLHEQYFQVKNIEIQAESFATMQQALADRGRQRSFIFQTPTAFKRTASPSLALPQPEYVFGSLMDKWAAFAPAPLPEELRPWFLKSLSVRYCCIESREISFERVKRDTITGFMGAVRFGAEAEDLDLRALWHSLCDFALYSGVGVKTGFGLGMVQPLANKGEK